LRKKSKFLIYSKKTKVTNLFKAKVLIKRRPSILDPQGKAVEKGAFHLGLTNIKDTRIGKYIEFSVDTSDRQSAEKEVNEYCSKLLANPIMEDYEFTLESAQ
jgi:phosphoribosylformylglycinamidine synthase subunit PurS